MDAPLRDGAIHSIIERYKSGELFKEEDLQLYEAAEKLESARRHYFDGMTIRDMTPGEYEEAQTHREQLRQIANAIWRLLIRRYGCND